MKVREHRSTNSRLQFLRAYRQALAKRNSWGAFVLKVGAL